LEGKNPVALQAGKEEEGCPSTGSGTGVRAEG